ncbi:MAG: flagellar hook-associated protein FlgK [Verrucomicrobiota bacterium]|nr:flagellar hook-associated protein FlgK [Verrucomicrobiota bacterium]
MAGLMGTLGTSVNAIKAHTSALDVAGRNLANVNNPAYARQRVVFGDRGSMQTTLGAQSLGVEAVGLAQYRNAMVDNQIVLEQFNGSSLESRSQLLHQVLSGLENGSLASSSSGVETIGDTPTAPKGLPDILDAFFNAWQDFSIQPNNPVQKQFLLDRTDALINKLNLTDSRLADVALPATVVPNSLTRQIDNDVSTTNGLLSKIADLNKQIGSAEIGNIGSALDLRDKRQESIESLSKLINFTSTEQSNGLVTIQLQDSTSTQVDLVDGGILTGTLSRNGSDFEWQPTTGSTVTLDVTGGRLHGEVQAGLDVQSFRDTLDSFVSNLVTKVNTAYNATTNGDFFAAAGTTAGTITRTVTSATLRAGNVGNPSGDNSNALAIASLAEDNTFSGGDTPANNLNRLISGFSFQVNDVDSRLEDSNLLNQTFKTHRNSYSGVSLDEEASDLVRFQRALQASSRVFSVVNELLGDIINMGK